MAVTNMTTPTGEALGAAARELVDYCASHQLIDWTDRVWAYNTVLACTGATGPAPAAEWVLADEPPHNVLHPARPVEINLEATLGLLADAAAATGIAEDTASARDRVAMRIMGALMPRPSEVTLEFHSRLDVGEKDAATSWFYRMCCDAGYVRRAAIARNIAWTCPTDWGDLEITINLSKPEKDPREIAQAGTAKPAGDVYPACQLCIENEGYPGRGAADPAGAHPARQNLRIVPIELDGKRWGLQYSPYAYFNEHCIAMSARHRPMHIDRKALTCLLDFVDLLPHYFIGSNADLPIVGGSILSHDHFQGGAHEFPMMRAAESSTFSLADHPGVSGAVLRWPLSVLRLRGRDRAEVLDAAMHVIDAWRGWSDETVGVVARSADGTPHNTVTPVVRRVDSEGRAGGSIYEVYLALRCNLTSEEHPLGIFHPHAEYHHIKKENIGLIEVMGLAILPPRLKPEMAVVEDALVAAAGKTGGTADQDSVATLCRELTEREDTASHAAWAGDVLSRRAGEITPESAHDIVQEEIGRVFAHVLENAGVFKWDDSGRVAQQRFIDSL